MQPEAPPPPPPRRAGGGGAGEGRGGGSTRGGRPETGRDVEDPGCRRRGTAGTPTSGSGRTPWRSGRRKGTHGRTGACRHDVAAGGSLVSPRRVTPRWLGPAPGPGAVDRRFPSTQYDRSSPSSRKLTSGAPMTPPFD